MLAGQALSHSAQAGTAVNETKCRGPSTAASVPMAKADAELTSCIGAQTSKCRQS